tara:strand:- start:340 stop:1287 length:948 start_codon:yes stop_codon:yes gene_type:complete
LKYTVTGCAGFIGSNLVDKLLQKNCKVFGIDNLTTGKNEFLESALNNKNFTFVNDDIFQIDNYKKLLEESDTVFHLAANADVRFGLKHPMKDLQENTINTCKLLEAMRSVDVKNIIFASTGSVYGESEQIPTLEFCPFPIQTSLYGASKVAAEAFISAYCEGFSFNAVACRFVSLMGPRYTHGHVYDFVKSLKNNPNELTILGDGKQFKSYFHVDDCVNGMILFSNLFEKMLKGFNPINLGTEEGITVAESAKIISDSIGLNPEYKFTGGKQGWIGDNPIIQLDISRAKELGWFPKKSIKESIKQTAQWVHRYLT